MTTDTTKSHRIVCFGHIFKAVFICAVVVIVVNLVHIIIDIRHADYIHTAAPTVSIFCYLCIVIAQFTWIHYFFYPEFFLNALALPIKIIFAVSMLFNSIDLLEINIEELQPSTDVNKDIIRTVRAASILIGVVLELYVFRLCQSAHHLMKVMQKEEGRRHFDVKRFLSAKDILGDDYDMKEKPALKKEAATNSPNNSSSNI